MGDSTGIEWADATWNPVRGCSRVSEGCRHCYAERVAERFSGPGQAYEGLVRIRKRAGGKPHPDGWNGEVRLVPEHLADPLRWRKPRRIFVNSMSDLFHEKLSNEEIAAVFGVMACSPHTFMVLTKRARRMREWFEWLRGPSEDTFTMQQRGIVAAPNTARALLNAAYEYLGKVRKPELDAAWNRLEDDPYPLPNVWFGVSVENQEAADDRIPELLATPAAVRFLSCEPLIGAVALPQHDQSMGSIHSPLDWIIAGCESGPGARPCDVAWLRSLRDQCTSAGVPFFLKQAVACCDRMEPRAGHVMAGPGSKRKPGGVIGAPYLDGRQHLAFPSTAEIRR